MDNLPISFIVALPAIIVFVIAALCTVFRGYKRGLKHAVISLITTAISGIVAVLVSRLLSTLFISPFKTLLTTVLEGVIPAETASYFGGVASIAEIFTIFAQALVSLLIYFAISWLVVLYLKLFSHSIVAEYVPEETSKGKKWAGFGVAWADAFLVTLIIVVPLYGFVGTISRTASTTLKATEFVIDTMNQVTTQADDVSNDSMEFTETMSDAKGEAKDLYFTSTNKVAFLDDEPEAKPTDSNPFDFLPKSGSLNFGSITVIFDKINDAPMMQIMCSDAFNWNYRLIFAADNGVGTVSIAELMDNTTTVVSATIDAWKEDPEKAKAEILTKVGDIILSNDAVAESLCTTIRDGIYALIDGNSGEESKISQPIIDMLRDYADNLTPDVIRGDMNAFGKIAMSMVSNGVLANGEFNLEAFAGDKFVTDYVSAINESASLTKMKAIIVKLVGESLYKIPTTDTEVDPETGESREITVENKFGVMGEMCILMSEAFDKVDGEILTQEELDKEIITVRHLAKAIRVMNTFNKKNADEGEKDLTFVGGGFGEALVALASIDSIGIDEVGKLIDKMPEDEYLWEIVRAEDVANIKAYIELDLADATCQSAKTAEFFENAFKTRAVAA